MASLFPLNFSEVCDTIYQTILQYINIDTEQGLKKYFLRLFP